MGNWTIEGLLAAIRGWFAGAINVRSLYTRSAIDMVLISFYAAANYRPKSESVSPVPN
jgi:hypothetical protein